MSWQKVGKQIASYAPVLGGLVAGPAGSKVGSLIASALGVNNDPDSIMEALKTDPNAAVKLQELQNDHKQKLESLAIESFKAEVEDRDSARRHNSSSVMPAVICVLLTAVVVLIGWALFTLNIPEHNREIAYLLFGTVIAKWGDSIAYFVGTTRSSAVKTDLLKK